MRRTEAWELVWEIPQHSWLLHSLVAICAGCCDSQHCNRLDLGSYPAWLCCVITIKDLFLSLIQLQKLFAVGNTHVMCGGGGREAPHTPVMCTGTWKLLCVLGSGLCGQQRRWGGFCLSAPLLHSGETAPADLPLGMRSQHERDVKLLE